MTPTATLNRSGENYVRPGIWLTGFETVAMEFSSGSVVEKGRDFVVLEGGRSLSDMEELLWFTWCLR